MFEMAQGQQGRCHLRSRLRRQSHLLHGRQEVRLPRRRPRTEPARIREAMDCSRSKKRQRDRWPSCVETRHGDALRPKDLKDATVVVMYMFPEFMDLWFPIAKRHAEARHAHRVARLQLGEGRSPRAWEPTATATVKSCDPRQPQGVLWVVPRKEEKVSARQAPAHERSDWWVAFPGAPRHETARSFCEFARPLCALAAAVSPARHRMNSRKPRTAASILYVPSEQVVVEKMLEMAKVKKTDVVFDLGCGDGRIVVHRGEEVRLQGRRRRLSTPRASRIRWKRWRSPTSPRSWSKSAKGTP